MNQPGTNSCSPPAAGASGGAGCADLSPRPENQSGTSSIMRSSGDFSASCSSSICCCSQASNERSGDAGAAGRSVSEASTQSGSSALPEGSGTGASSGGGPAGGCTQSGTSGSTGGSALPSIHPGRDAFSLAASSNGWASRSQSGRPLAAGAAGSSSGSARSAFRSPKSSSSGQGRSAPPARASAADGGVRSPDWNSGMALKAST